MMGLIKKNFSWLNMAAVCFDEYPADLGMYFVLNGVNSYFSMFDSIEQFKIGVAKILEGKEFVSEVVKDRISIRKSEPEPARRLPQKHIEVIRCICNGFNKYEIADNLYLSPRTVENYREEIYRSLNVNDIADLFRAALRLRFVTEDELIFCPRKITLKPLPNIKKEQRETGARNKDYGG
jgi:DNA-binding CsgD family transcriptional regulator